VEARVDDLVDWVVDAELREWQAVSARLADRRREYRDRVVGDREVGTFHADRARLVNGVAGEVQRVVDSYDKERESRALAEGARNAVAAAAATGAGALGLGTVVTAAATTAAMDVTGLVMAGVVGVIAFFIIPARRRRARRDMEAKVTEMRAAISASISGEFDREIGRGLERIRESFTPYARFVRSEREKLESVRATLEARQQVLQALRARVEHWRPAA
jgi:hypothetical protein